MRFKKEKYYNGFGYSLRCTLDDGCESFHTYIPKNTRENIKLAQEVLCEKASLEHWRLKGNKVYCHKHYYELYEDR